MKVLSLFDPTINSNLHPLSLFMATISPDLNCGSNIATDGFKLELVETLLHLMQIVKGSLL